MTEYSLCDAALEVQEELRLAALLVEEELVSGCIKKSQKRFKAIMSKILPMVEA